MGSETRSLVRTELNEWAAQSGETPSWMGIQMAELMVGWGCVM